MTGDVTINPSASALIMTTEVRFEQNIALLDLVANLF